MKRSGWFFTVITGVLVVAGLLVAYYSGATLVPACVAFIIAYILDPFVGLFERKGINRSLSIVIVLLMIALITTLGLGYFAASIANEFKAVQINLPDYVSRLYGLIPAEIKTYFGIETPQKAYLQLERHLDQLQGGSFDVFRETFSYLKRAVTSTLAFILSILGFVITPLYLFYFMKDIHKIKSAAFGLVPDRYRQQVSKLAAEIHDILSGFVRGQVTVCAILAVLYSIGLLFIGIDLALVIGTLSGVLFIIPYLGTILGIVLSMSMALLKYHDLLHPLLCLGWFFVVQFIEGTFITPKIVGDKVGLHPIVTVLALLIGGQLFGVIGMLIAVPATAVFKVLLTSYLSYYRTCPYFTGE